MAKANEIVTQLRAGIDKYKDYHVALDEGYKIFLPNVPQPEYHFTNYKNGFLEAFNFDPARPTSLALQKNRDRVRTSRRDVHHAEARHRRTIK